MDGADGPDGPWDRYARAVVEIVVADGVLELTPRPGEVPVPSAAAAAAPVGGRLAGPVSIVTAGDPYPEVLDAATNAARMAALVARLDADGVTHLPALGRSPDHRESEVSRALLGLERSAVLRIAAADGQLAVFEIDGATIACVAVTDGVVQTRRAYDAVLRP